MKLELMIAFVSVIRCGSIRSAAKHLNQSQPGITKKIKSLEDELGVSLITRSAQGVELTPYGEKFLVRAKSIINEASRAKLEIEQLRGNYQGTVRFMIAPSSTIDLIPRAVRIFQNQYPAIKIEIQEGLQTFAIEQLRLGQVDFAIVPLWEPLPKNEFETELVENMAMAIITSANSQLKKITRLDQLTNAHWIHVGTGGTLSPVVSQMFEKHSLSTPEPKMECFSLTSTLAFLFDSDAVALLPAKLALQPMYSNLLTVLPIEDELPNYPLCIVFRRDSPLTPAARALASTVCRVANKPTD